MAKIILACSQKPLAAFIETVLAGFEVDLKIVVDVAELTAMSAEFKPDIFIVNSGFPFPADNPALLAELRSTVQVPVVSVCEPVEIDLADNGGALQTELPDVLMLPFAENDLQQKIEKLTGLTLIKKSDLKPGVEKSATPAVDLIDSDLQPEDPEEKDEVMEKVEAEAVKTFELTEIVEEGLPLDELPVRVVSENSIVEPDELAAETDLADEAVGVKGSIAADADDFDLDDFGDSLDDLELDLQEVSPPESGAVAESSENEVTTLLEAEMPSKTVDAADAAVSADAAAVAAESEIEASKPLEPIAGDFDALLDDDDFAEVEIPETEDPVLAGLKSAGLTPEVAIPEAEIEPADDGEDDNPGSDSLDDLNDYEDLLDGLAAVEGGTDAAPSGNKTVESEREFSADVEAAAEFVEMPRPEEVLSPELTLPSAPIDTPSVAAGIPAAASVELVAPVAAEIELPEDYIEDEDIMSEPSAADPDIESQPALHSPAASAPIPEISSPAEHRVFTEPQSLDFSQQIEGMTQEWSKQLLQTTYASMDKMIKAIGDLAPTIVNQVAREVIPPLAEKVIKAEIARLEEQLKLEEGEEESE